MKVLLTNDDGIEAEGLQTLRVALAALPEIAELNIGHFLVGEAVFTGFAASIKMMRAAMDRGRAKAAGSA